MYALTRLDQLVAPLRPDLPDPLLQPGLAAAGPLGLQPLAVTRCAAGQVRRQGGPPDGLAHAAPQPLPRPAHLGDALRGVERVGGREGGAAPLPLGAPAPPSLAPGMVKICCDL